MTPPRRDPTLEHEVLARAELEAGASGFAEHALRRLAAGEELYGDRWATAGLLRLVDELRDEAADLGSWGVLALQALADDSSMSTESRQIIEIALEATVRFGAVAHCALELARSHANGDAGATR